jgi:preprotein translocase subunit SecD
MSTVPSLLPVVVQGRPVLAAYSPNERVHLTCPADTCTPSELKARTVTLAGDAGSAYRLGPAFFTEDQIASASALTSADPSMWDVFVTLDAAGARGLKAATSRALQHGSDGRIATIVNGRVVSAPVVRAAIGSGPIQLSGFTQQEAQHLADQLNA